MSLAADLRCSAIALVAAAFSSAAASAADWPQHLGPSRDGVYPAAPGELNFAWKTQPPKIAWERAVGPGFAGEAAAGGKVFLFHRDGDEEALECLDLATGKGVWRGAYPTDYQDSFGFDSGPRAVPAVTAAQVVTFGAGGVLTCWERATGKKLWSVPTHEKFQVRQAFFGAACSPLVVGDRVLVDVGGKAGGIVAFALATGEVLWNTPGGEASYASPVLAQIGGAPHAIFFSRNGWIDVDPRDGRIRSQLRWRARIAASVNAATPLVVGDEAFISASYDTGANLLKIHENGVESKWSNDLSLSNHYSTSVVRDGLLFGLHGRQEEGPSLRCVEWATGKVCWSQDDQKVGSLILVGDRILFLREDGRLDQVAARGDAYQLLDSYDFPAGVYRPLAALSDGFFLARNEKKLFALDLRAAKP